MKKRWLAMATMAAILLIFPMFSSVAKAGMWGPDTLVDNYYYPNSDEYEEADYYFQYDWQSYDSVYRMDQHLNMHDDWFTYTSGYVNSDVYFDNVASKDHFRFDE
jgi:hypothetical protein